MPAIHYHIGSDYPVLSAFMQSRAPVSIIMGPRGSAKTFSAAQRCLMHMEEQEPNDRGIRPTRGLITRDSYAELMNTTIPDFRSVLGDIMDFTTGSSGTPTARTKPGVTLPDGTILDAEVIFQSSGVIDAPERAKGFQLTYAWFNEFSGTDRAFFQRVREALGRYPSTASGGVRCTWRGVFCDTNAFDESHWLFPIVTNPPEGWEFFRQPGGVRNTGRLHPDGRIVWEPNPDAENLANLPPDYYMQLCAGNKDDSIKVLLANEFGFHVDGMPVHPWYVDSVHCAAQPIEADASLPIYVGADFGRTPAATLWQYHPKMGRWCSIDELTSENMSAVLFAPELKRKLDREYPGAKVRGFGDPAGDKSGQTVETTPIDIMRANGIPMQEAPSNVEALRRAAITGPGTRVCMDGRPALLVSPRCKTLRKGLMGGFCYRRKRIKGTEEYTEEPDKNQYSHVVESAEYALLGGGEGAAALRPAAHLYGGREAEPMWAETNW
jgi:hypothetical protein